jgi:trehalose synthase
MSIQLSDYEPVVGTDVIEELRVMAKYVKHRKLQNINSTAVGGGVAELLTRLILLLRDLEVDVTWDVMKGNEAFFAVTKEFHNALHGKPSQITPEMLDAYRSTTEDNARTMALGEDVIVIHDPQPAGLIDQRSHAGRHWIWRCHIDVSNPDPFVWDFLRPMVERYDAAIFSMPEFSQNLPIPQYMVPPSIDPLADKNKELDEDFVNGVMAGFGVDPDRPILTQISRFDRLKDPLGVLAAYRTVKRRQDCQLILAGGGATDDPEGEVVLSEVKAQAGNDPDVHILLLPPFSDLQINALVRGSTIIFQKSLKEGFGLTVSEALWKRKPVIGGAVGGIRLQILDGVTGFLVYSPEGAAQRALQLLTDRKLRARIGENGYLHVKENFLITRHVKDILLLLLAVEHKGEHVVRLS